MNVALSVQQAVVAALGGVAGLSGVFDGPPPDAAAPYAVIGPDLVTDRGHSGGRAHEVRFLVTIWDDRAGGARLRGLVGRAVAALTAMTGNRDGQRIVLSRLLRATVEGADAGWRAGRIEIAVLTETI
jgi:hypothetical protein